MLDRVMLHDELIELVEELGRKRRLIGPVLRELPECKPPRRYFYQQVDHADQIDLAFDYCVYSPKRFLFPARETLFVFDQDAHGFTARAVFDDRPLALVGVHPCDIHAIQLLDRVFSADPSDDHYLTRRQSAFIIAVDCAAPCTGGVFCADMKTHSAADGFDVCLYPFDHRPGLPPSRNVRYGMVFGSRAGREWVLYGRKGLIPTAADERAFEQYQREKLTAFPSEIRTPAEDLPALLDRSYDSLLWEATARRCYSCGSCNAVCPTCYCFNMVDETPLGGRGGERCREWDGCQLPNFALVAGGHNFRSKTASRLRHRIYRKAKWVRQRTGLGGCVGCARCDRACTARINSVEIYNQLAEEV